MIAGLKTVTEPAASSSSTSTGAFQSRPSSDSCTPAAVLLVELESGAAVYGSTPRWMSLAGTWQEHAEGAFVKMARAGEARAANEGRKE